MDKRQEAYQWLLGYFEAINASISARNMLTVLYTKPTTAHNIDAILEKNVYDLFEISVRCASVLRNNKDPVQTVRQLISYTESQILMMPNAGRKMLNELREGLALYGLSFAQNNQ